MKWLKQLGHAAHCFFDWPMLHTRVYVYAFLIFAGYQIDRIIGGNIAAVSNEATARAYSDSRILYLVVDSLIFSSVLVIGFYVSPKVADYITSVLSSRLGGTRTVDKKQED